MEQVSQKYWAKSWPNKGYNPPPASKAKPAEGDYKWILENR